MGMRSKVLYLRLLAGVSGIASAAVLTATPAAAQAVGAAANPDESGSVALEEIVVTAQRRAENLQEVPIAVSAVTASALERSGVSTTNALPQLIPSVQFTRSGGSGLFFVRGVGTSNAAVGEEGANAFYIDNVYIADLGQTINNFNNIDRIEVLKGPQGTLFGRNAFGGLIHIITREPGDQLEMKGQVGYSNFDTSSAQFYVGGPLAEKVSADFAWTFSNQNDGWGRNLTLDRDIKMQDYWGVRSKLLVRPVDRVKLILAGDYYRNRDDLALAWKIKPGTVGVGGQTGPSGQDTTANFPAFTRQEFWGLSLTGEFDLGFAQLTNVSAMRRTSNHSGFDADGGPLRALELEFTSGSKSYQEELRLASQGNRRLSWQVGAFYLRSEADNVSAFMGSLFPAVLREQDIFANLTTDSYAAFGEATYLITPSTQLTGGLRYTRDHRNFFGSSTNVLASGVPLTPSTQNSQLTYNEVTYRVALRQDLSDTANVYASINRGFKAGTYSLQSPLNPPAKPQFIMAYEVGLKSELFDRRLRLNLAAYHYDIDDYQVRSAAASAPGTTILFNAATVKVDGFDLEFEALATDAWRLFGGFTVLNSRYGKFGGQPLATTAQAPFIYPIFAGQTQATTCPAALRGTPNPGINFPGTPAGGFFTCFGDASGLKTPLAPKFTASLGTSYTLSLGSRGDLNMTALYSYNSGYVFEPDNRFRQKSFNLLNASVEYKPTENVGLELWARNLTNEEYSVQNLSSATGVTDALAPPRTYGVNLKVQY